MLVSVIVAVYNREELLDRCLFTLTNQTYDEIEIILVDDFSKDGSWKKLECWQNKYPQIIKIFKNDIKGVSYAKNLGIRMSKGEYIAFVDSDDFVNFDYIESMVNCWNRKKSSMVISPIYKCNSQSIASISVISSISDDSIKSILSQDYFFLHGKLISKELFTEFGYLPNISIGEDSSWLFPVLSNLEQITYNPKPAYYYVYSDNSVSLQCDSVELVEDYAKGADYVLSNTNPKYESLAVLYSVKRLYFGRSKYGLHSKILDKKISEILPKFLSLEETYGEYKWLGKKIGELLNVDYKIPNRIIISGLDDVDDEWRRDIYRKFASSYQIIEIKESDFALDNEVVNEAYQSKNYSPVVQYTAIKNIYNYGGIYLNENIIIDNQLDDLRKNPCFVAFDGMDSFSSDVVGSQCGSDFIHKILKTYEIKDLYDNVFENLGHRIRTVVVGYTNIWLTPKYRNMSNGLGVVIYGLCAFCVNYDDGNGHFGHCRDQTGINDEVYTYIIESIKRESKAKAEKEVKQYKNEIDKIENEFDKKIELLLREYNNSKSENAVLKAELEQIKKSKSWRYTDIFRKILFRIKGV